MKKIILVLVLALFASSCTKKEVGMRFAFGDDTTTPIITDSGDSVYNYNFSNNKIERRKILCHQLVYIEGHRYIESFLLISTITRDYVSYDLEHDPDCPLCSNNKN